MAAPMRIGALLTSAGKYVLRPEVTRPCAALLQHAPLTTDAGGSKATTGAKAPPPPPPKAADPGSNTSNDDRSARRLKSKSEATTPGTPNHVASQWTVSVLKQLLRQKGIKFKASTRKADLLTLLRESEAKDGNISSGIDTASNTNRDMSSQLPSPHHSLYSEFSESTHRTVSELRQLLKERGIKFKMSDRKGKLVELLVKAQSVDTQTQDTVVQAKKKEGQPRQSMLHSEAGEDGDATEAEGGSVPEVGESLAAKAHQGLAGQPTTISAAVAEMAAAEEAKSQSTTGEGPASAGTTSSSSSSESSSSSGSSSSSSSDSEGETTSGQADIITKEAEATEVITKDPEAAEVITKETEAAEVITKEPEAAEVITKEAEAAEVITKEPEAAEVITKEPVAAEVITKDPEAAQVITKDPEAAQVITKEAEAAEVITKEPEAAEVITEEPEVAQVITEAAEVTEEAKIVPQPSASPEETTDVKATPEEQVDINKSPELEQVASAQANEASEAQVAPEENLSAGGDGTPGLDGEATETEKPAAAGPVYKVPEYYSYNPLSFYDIDASCDQHRLPQPSNKK